MKEALYYEKLSNERVKCLLCPHYCLIKEGKTGICRARINQQGRLYSRVYEQCSSVVMDPIEKKPLYHLAPGRQILSLGTVGCNLKCQFCQNWHISQLEAPTQPLSSEEVIKMAKKYNSLGVAYTYNEPIIWYEYVMDIAKLVKKKGLRNVMVTNGFINPEPLLELLPYIDAFNIDVKSFDDDFYKRMCFGRLEPVLKAAQIAKEKGALVEITNLIIPTLNDKLEELSDLIAWVKDKLGDDTPLHFSAYLPNYKLHLPPTPFSTLERAAELAAQSLKYVYLGNVYEKRFNTTYCPRCKKAVIVRNGYTVSHYKIVSSQCQYCQEVIYGLDL